MTINNVSNVFELPCQQQKDKSIDEICFSNFDDHYRWPTTTLLSLSGFRTPMSSKAVWSQSVVKKLATPHVKRGWIWKKWENTQCMVCRVYQIVLITQNTVLIVSVVFFCSFLYISTLGYHISLWPLNILYFVVSAPLPNSHPFLSLCVSLSQTRIQANCPMHNSCVLVFGKTLLCWQTVD